MRTHRIISLAAMLQLLWIFAGCCADPQLVYYEWTSMNTTHLDNSGRGLLENESGPIPAEAYGMRIVFERSETIAARFSPIPTAYATSCPDIYKFFNRDTVRAIRIHATADGDTARDVTDDFVVLNYTFDETDKFISIPEMLRQRNDGSQAWVYRVDLLRTKNPERSIGTRFTVTMEISGGETIADTTGSVTLI